MLAGVSPPLSPFFWVTGTPSPTSDGSGACTGSHHVEVLAVSHPTEPSRPRPLPRDPAPGASEPPPGAWLAPVLHSARPAFPRTDFAPVPRRTFRPGVRTPPRAPFTARGPAPRRDVTKRPQSPGTGTVAAQRSLDCLPAHGVCGAGGAGRPGLCARLLPSGGGGNRRGRGGDSTSRRAPRAGAQAEAQSGPGGARRRSGGRGARAGLRREPGGRRRQSWWSARGPRAAEELVERSGSPGGGGGGGGGGGEEEAGGGSPTAGARPGPSRELAVVPPPRAAPTPGPSAAAMARPLVPSSQKALLLELKGLQEEPVEGFRVTLVDEGDLYNWEVAIFGPPNTYYEGGYFKVSAATPPRSPSPRATWGAGDPLPASQPPGSGLFFSYVLRPLRGRSRGP
ncbi:hypothetical protein P7K49_032677 [Saguinus oedipus]|uniref:UBC core domain-containing protein n=1 Tax=Saguinus oedipus TaxID=9490 RepID=A0ABQ9TQI6_SAGOE|nr:hypothetical protein P7K49_032677 [Saguinus oedipus]